MNRVECTRHTKGWTNGLCYHGHPYLDVSVPNKKKKKEDEERKKKRTGDKREREIQLSGGGIVLVDDIKDESEDSQWIMVRALTYGQGSIDE